MAAAVREVSGLPTMVSGGISGIEDLRAIKEVSGFYGVISGKALYEGALDYKAGAALLSDLQDTYVRPTKFGVNRSKFGLEGS
jgi:phosphoribosylformimino-5-aminoimidazole carboxamide ribonucleotide (ProFAR) isomerase